MKRASHKDSDGLALWKRLNKKQKETELEVSFNYNSFLIGIVLSSMFFGYIISTKFVSKAFVLSQSFYMGGTFYKLEKVGK